MAPGVTLDLTIEVTDPKPSEIAASPSNEALKQPQTVVLQLSNLPAHSTIKIECKNPHQVGQRRLPFTTSRFIDENYDDEDETPSNTSSVDTFIIPRLATIQERNEHTSSETSDDTLEGDDQISVLQHYKSRRNRLSGTYRIIHIASNADRAGIYATQPIKEGTRIICERPLFTVTAANNNPKGIKRAFDSLSKGDKARVWALPPCHDRAPDYVKTLHRNLMPIIENLTGVLVKAKEDRTEEEQLELEQNSPELLETMKIQRLAARWHAHQFCLVNMTKAERKHLPASQPVEGLFMERSKLRHSCVPNCYAVYNQSTHRMTVHTTKDVAYGEELTASVISEKMYYECAAQRKERLLEYGIFCNCEACDTIHPLFQTHEETRLQAWNKALTVIEFCGQLEMHDFPSVLRKLQLSVGDGPGQDATMDELREAEQMILSLCMDLRKTKCTGAELIRWRNVVIDRIQSKIGFQLPRTERVPVMMAMGGHAKACAAIALRCFGEDHEEYQRLKTLSDMVVDAAQKAHQMVKEWKERGQE